MIIDNYFPMHEPAESIIQTDVYEPTIHDVMSELITINDRLDGHDERLESIDKRFDRIESILHEIQKTLAEHGNMLIEHSKILAVHSKALIQLTGTLVSGRS